MFLRSKARVALLGLCWIAFTLRLGPAFDNRFHPDEALFSSWALKIAHGENVLLTAIPVDKPPLLIYLTAISFFFFGQTEIAARWPNLVASMISVLLVYRLARAGSNHAAPLLASTLLALAPFAILFAPTAFLDPTMVMFGLASLVAASRGRAGWAGLFLGLSFATKVQGLFFAPLVLVYWSTSRSVNQGSVNQGSVIGDWSSYHVVSSKTPHPTGGVSPYPGFLVSFLAIAAAVLAWDRLRGGLPFWVQQTINYGGIRLIYPGEVGPRLIGWLALLPYFFGPIVGLLGLIGLPFLIWLDLTRHARTRAAFVDLALITYLIAFLAFHWLLAFPVWDRYLLIALPIAALLISRVLSYLVNWILSRFVNLSSCHPVTSKTPHAAGGVSLLLSSLLVLPYSLAAAQSQYPIGGDHGAYDGIDQVAAYLRTLPSGTVVYDHWLTWELDYYLGEGHVYLAYFDTPTALADDLRAFARSDDRYVVFPARESPDKVIDAIGAAGFSLSPVFSTPNRFSQTSFTVFRIQSR